MERKKGARAGALGTGLSSGFGFSGIGPLQFGVLALAALLHSACSGPTQPEPAGEPTKEGTATGGTSAKQSKDVLEETWEAIYLGGAKAGHVHGTVSRITLEGQERRRVVKEMQLTVARSGQATTQKVLLASIETPEGAVVRFMGKITLGESEMTVRAEASDDKLEMTSQTPGKTQSSTLAWNKTWGGLLAVDESLKKTPLAAGESRELRMLVPDFPFPSAGTLKLAAVGLETTDLLDGPRELLKIKQTVEVDSGTTTDWLLWTDKRGAVLKTQMVSGLAQIAYRTTKEIAMAESAVVEFDLERATTVRVARALPPNTKRVVYKAHLKEGDARRTFVLGATQTVRPIDEHTALVEVRAIRPGEPAELATPDEPPTADDLAPNGLIQSDDPQVIKLAAGVAKGESDPWKLAVALEQHVNQSIKSTNFSQAFATAAETARSLEGDCTEHAMLLAAVCRARQIPARVAVGLVNDGKRGFAFHMWTEVWISDRWVPLDATRGQGGIDAGYLKLAHSHLKVASITTALFPVFNVLGRLKLEIVEAE